MSREGGAGAPPPAINIHGAPSVHRPKPRHAKTLSADATRRPRPQPKAREPQPKAREPASAETRRPSPRPAVRTPKQPAAEPPVKPSRIRPPAARSVVGSTPEVLSPKPMRLARPSLVPAVTRSPQISPEPPPRVLASPRPDPEKRDRPEAARKPPTPPRPRGSRTRRGLVTRGSPYGAWLDAARASSRGTPASTSPAAPSRRRHTPPPPPGRRRSFASAPSSPTLHPSRRRPANAPTSILHLDSLADAMVAGSLASSRLTPHNTGTSLPPPSLPGRQRSPRLLQTLRQPAASPDEDSGRHGAGRGRRHKLRRGKHAHHEGSRKRWREAMTPRERRRYEAVWASNRGLLLEQDRPPPGVASGLGTDASACVANVVVRDIWRRSRLPEDELAEVWDLVDGDARGMLARQEFVVGMWLIDQRLRGRKLPQRVSDSVWGSANGVTVKQPRAG
ncbi:Increased rDNA silencing protein 4 [Tolypocladium capitatum]|uniref:Increased rDNA silencing protein 4 n=1 Tax=Tolypocladium capitatum TaxID=45235 RepID=A0A2K3QEX9_9HYPO|nr:Increased rDNA silencing protein 4 [Tolypocladium capitatum]